MPRRNPLIAPLGKIKDTALDALRHPKDTAEKVVEQARGTVSLGRSVAEGVVTQVASRVPGRRSEDAPPAGSQSESESQSPARRPSGDGRPTRPHGDPLAEDRPSPRKSAKKAAKKASPAEVAKKAPAKKAAAKKAAAKEAPAADAAPGTEDELVYTSESMPDEPGDKLPRRGRSVEDGEGLIDPALTKQVAAEAERGRRDAEGPGET